MRTLPNELVLQVLERLTLEDQASLLSVDPGLLSGAMAPRAAQIEARARVARLPATADPWTGRKPAVAKEVRALVGETVDTVDESLRRLPLVELQSKVEWLHGRTFDAVHGEIQAAMAGLPEGQDRAVRHVGQDVPARNRRIIGRFEAMLPAVEDESMERFVRQVHVQHLLKFGVYLAGARFDGLASLEDLVEAPDDLARQACSRFILTGTVPPTERQRFAEMVQDFRRRLGADAPPAPARVVPFSHASSRPPTLADLLGALRIAQLGVQAAGSREQMARILVTCARQIGACAAVARLPLTEDPWTGELPAGEFTVEELVRSICRGVEPWMVRLPLEALRSSVTVLPPLRMSRMLGMIDATLQRVPAAQQAGPIFRRPDAADEAVLRAYTATLMPVPPTSIAATTRSAQLGQVRTFGAYLRSRPRGIAWLGDLMRAPETLARPVVERYLVTVLIGRLSRQQLQQFTARVQDMRNVLATASLPATAFPRRTAGP